ncbi:MAG TPA: hypothetical protein VHU40_19890, partial [Polyangia bacterium]|nr:hypothetical protein [Polyangia bacterium]
EYPRAIAEFKAAYNAKPDPLLLYNIAQSFRLANDATQALFFYRSFLRNMPNASNRKEVEGRIRTLEKQAERQAEDQKAIAPPPVVAPAEPAPTRPPPVAVVPPAPVGPPPGPVTPAPAAAPTPTSPPPATPAVTEPPSTPATTVDLTPPPPDAPATPSSSPPFYKRWWFWTGIGALVLIGLAASTHDKAPSSTLGSYDPTFVKPLGGGP